jgi:hypothetical protein
MGLDAAYAKCKRMHAKAVCLHASGVRLWHVEKQGVLPG